MPIGRQHDHILSCQNSRTVALEAHALLSGPRLNREGSSTRDSRLRIHLHAPELAHLVPGLAQLQREPARFVHGSWSLRKHVFSVPAPRG